MLELQPLSDKHRKLARSLHLKKHREENKLFLAEGPNVSAELVRSQFHIEFVVVQSDRIAEFDHLIRLFRKRNVEVFALSERLFAQMSDASSPQGIAAVAAYSEQPIMLPQRCIALDGMQDPGNVGTIIRTAHFFGYDAVYLSETSADQYSPKLIRSAMGSSFHIPLIRCTLDEQLRELHNSHQLIGAGAHADALMSDVEPSSSFCLIIGSEAHGISSEVKKLVDRTFRIPGGDGAESLNASVAAGIAMYHFSRPKHS